jgi:signal transduction histidine kinase
MSERRPSSFWHYSLKAELLASALVALVLLAGGWIALRQLQHDTINLLRADGERVNLYLDEHLAAGIQQLEQLAQLPAKRRAAMRQLPLPSFSDLYVLDGNKRVVQVLQTTPGSRVFAGFSFAGSQIHPYLRQSALAPVNGHRSLPLSSPITRGLEDELASIYVLRPLAADGTSTPQWLLGRLNLRYIEGFLDQFSRFSGTPVLLVSRDGFVMLQGRGLPLVPAIDLRIASTSGNRLSLLTIEGKPWLPVVAADTGLGARIVTLVPQQRLREQQQAVMLAAGAATALLLLVLALKNLRLKQQLFNPVGHFAVQLKQLEARYRSPGPQADDLALTSRGVADFEEIQLIQQSFAGLMEAIRQRDHTLQQQLRTSLTAAAIAHEINLPLSTIRLLCQQARQQLGHGLDVDALVTNLDAQSQQVSRVIEQMRTLLRNVLADQQPTDLAEVVRSACALVKALLREQRVQLSCEGLEQEAGAWVIGDAVQLQVAVANLLRNGIEAVASQPLERRRLRVRLERWPGEGLAVCVADSGPGFAFEPRDNTLFRSTKASGSGLGLYMVRTTAANHGGRLLLGSSADLGGAEATLVFKCKDQRLVGSSIS